MTHKTITQTRGNLPRGNVCSRARGRCWAAGDGRVRHGRAVPAEAPRPSRSSGFPAPADAGESCAPAQKNPQLVKRAVTTLDRWQKTAATRSHEILVEWRRMLNQRDWRLAVAPDERGSQLRQASPLATLLPDEKRLAIIRRVKALKVDAHSTAPA